MTGSSRTLVVGGRVWLVADLDVTVDREGNPLAEVQAGEAWDAALSDDRAVFRRARDVPDGLLYNRVALNRLAPAGWRIPGEQDWTALEEAARTDPTVRSRMGFDRLPAVRGEDGSGYWLGHPDLSSESWGTFHAALGITRFSDVAMWGNPCPYGLRVRLVRDAGAAAS